MKQTFKHLIAALACLLISATLFAQSQVPQLFNYQGIARDAKGNPMSNQKMSLKLSVLPTADANVAEYEETQSVTTNEFGLYTLQIGNGTALTGQMKTVKWETGNKYIKVSIDPTGGNNYADAGTNQLLSVPYAIYADKAGTANISENDKTRTGAVNSNAAHVAGDVNYLTKFTALNTIGKSLIFDNGTSVGIGTASPSAASKLHLYTSTGNIEHLRMQNINPTGFGKFLMYNDVAGNYATFTKYGSTYPGGYPGVASMFPYANMLAFGNNLGPFLLANNGNIGIGIVTGGTTKLYFNAQQSTGYLGIGSSFVPSANVHFGNTATGDTLRVTNATTGHLKTDGLEIRMNNNAAEIVNRENSSLALGTNGITRVNITDSGKVEIGSTSEPGTLQFPAVNTPSAPMINMFTSGVNNSDRMIIAHSPDYPDYGIQYQDLNDNIAFLAAGTQKFSVNLGTGKTTISDGTQAAGSILTGNANGTASWSLPAAAGLLSGSGTDNTIAKFTPNGTTLGNSIITDDGFNVGVGNPAPSYKLDVQHGGATGIRSRSTGTFSLMDIDAANGDAALRFARAGVNQWNVRNRPADDYFEIFELNGGGSRVVIQDGTGNVGIGETVSPSYKLDVLHGGATGIRSRSSGTFSLMDIDAANGDAALRFAKAGVNQWNTRNNPGNDDYQIFELGGGGERIRIENGTGNVVVNSNFTAVGVKAFTIDHPLDPENKILVHAASESNEVINFYSGNVTTDANGKVNVTLPDYFEALNKDFRYQLTVIGTFARAIVSKEVSNNQFEITTDQPNVKVSWEVKGVRNDARMKKDPFVSVKEKTPTQKGKYIDPFAYNLPESKRVSYNEAEQSSLDAKAPEVTKQAPPTSGGSLGENSTK
ncbi:MAG: hypothetical protein IPF62_05555 [Bacteroidetes bacterium]|jgi:hypothetical protein|nr:hypothetical protein [Bacteroidota bacterium]MBK6821079.1 hypothetical protein [Bacteroidota bacterium]MBK7039322.1 hypothetical protein [Bacteroidota bacterium]MBK9301041.1 hypothetical protein [Bacteroidota bacterium]HMT34384.1 hypothetical protein [Chitinophagaceae bacterium]